MIETDPDAAWGGHNRARAGMDVPLRTLVDASARRPDDNGKFEGAGYDPEPSLS